MMKKTKTINIDSVGEVFFRKSERAKYVSITIKPGAGVIVSVPRFVSIKSAEKIAKSKLPKEIENPIKNLTDKECQMVKMVAGGLSSKQIAYQLGISVKTVDGRRRRIREKLHLNGFFMLVCCNPM